MIQQQYYYYPFGGIVSQSGSDPNHYKFSGKERDESGLDNFGARYFTSNMGRFMTPDWAARPTTVPYAVFGDPQSLNLYGYVRNDPVSRIDADGHGDTRSGQAEQCNSFDGSLYSSHGGSSSLLAAMLASLGGDSPAFGSRLDSDAYSPWEYGVEFTAQNQSQTQAQQNQQSNAPANSRTDVVLYSNEYTPKPTKETAWFWETTWKAGTCSGDRCSQSSANEKQTISLVESVNGGAFKPTGDPAKGTAHDQISPEPKTFNQHWFVDSKQVQLVVGKDSKGNLVKTWEVHVEIKNLGDRPVYSPVP